MLWFELPESVDAVAFHWRALDSGSGIAPESMFSVCRRFENRIHLNCSYQWMATVEAPMKTLGELVAA